MRHRADGTRRRDALAAVFFSNWRFRWKTVRCRNGCNGRNGDFDSRRRVCRLPNGCAPTCRPRRADLTGELPARRTEARMRGRSIPHCAPSQRGAEWGVYRTSGVQPALRACRGYHAAGDTPNAGLAVECRFRTRARDRRRSDRSAHKSHAHDGTDRKESDERAGGHAENHSARDHASLPERRARGKAAELPQSEADCRAAARRWRSERGAISARVQGGLNTAIARPTRPSRIRVGHPAPDANSRPCAQATTVRGRGGGHQVPPAVRRRSAPAIVADDLPRGHWRAAARVRRGRFLEIARKGLACRSGKRAPLRKQRVFTVAQMWRRSRASTPDQLASARALSGKYHHQRRKPACARNAEVATTRSALFAASAAVVDARAGLRRSNTAPDRAARRLPARARAGRRAPRWRRNGGE